MTELHSGPRRRGAVIVPAFNEAAVIGRTLEPLSRAARECFIELVVVCNGCTDNTADVARNIPGVTVLELSEGCKPAALNAGDAVASLWPRLYLDADIQISADTVLAVLDRLRAGDVLVARPEALYDSRAASAVVRSYYRAWQRLWRGKPVMWGAGVYGMTEAAHRRLGGFPDVTGDDLFVDSRFSADEKVLVASEPVVVTTPADTRSLLGIIRRGYRGGVHLFGAKEHQKAGLSTATALLQTITGPQSAGDSAVYVALSLMRRFGYDKNLRWERDDSSRVASPAE